MGKKSAQRLRAVAKKAANAVAEARKKEREDAPAAAPAVTATTPKARTRINSNAIMGMPSPFPPSDGSTIAAAIVVDDGSSDSDDVQEVRDERILPQKQEPAHQQVTAGRKCRNLSILFLLFALACAYFGIFGRTHSMFLKTVRCHLANVATPDGPLPRRNPQWLRQSDG